MQPGASPHLTATTTSTAMPAGGAAMPTMARSPNLRSNSTRTPLLRSPMLRSPMLGVNTLDGAALASPATTATSIASTSGAYPLTMPTLRSTPGTPLLRSPALKSFSLSHGNPSSSSSSSVSASSCASPLVTVRSPLGAPLRSPAFAPFSIAPTTTSSSSSPSASSSSPSSWWCLHSISRTALLAVFWAATLIALFLAAATLFRDRSPALSHSQVLLAHSNDGAFDHERGIVRRRFTAKRLLRDSPAAAATVADDNADDNTDTDADVADSSSSTDTPLRLHHKATPEDIAMLPERCGPWHDSYAELHRAMFNGTRAPRLLVMTIDPHVKHGGISDRWPTIVNAFYIALLTQRAFVLDWEDFWYVFDSPHLPWMQFDGATHPELYDAGRRPDSVAAYHHTWQYIMHRYYMQSNNTAYLQRFPTFDLAAFELNSEHKQVLNFHDFDALRREPGDARVTYEKATEANLLELLGEEPVYMLTTRGKGHTASWYSNPNIAPILRNRFGLRQDDAHGCIINYLFRPKPETLEPYRRVIDELLDPTTLTVGIQIRMGDSSMHSAAPAAPAAAHAASTNGSQTPAKPALSENERYAHVEHIELLSDDELDSIQNTTLRDELIARRDARLLESASTFVACAEEVSLFHMERRNQTVRWLLLSDHVGLRQALLRRYPDRVVLSNPNVKPAHTDTGDNVVSPTDAMQKRVSILRFAVAEQWIFAYVDYLVISHRRSGFGRSAALRSMRHENAFDGDAKVHCDAINTHLTTQNWVESGNLYRRRYRKKH